MGFSSFECSVSGYSIPAYPYADLPEELSRVCQVNENNEIIRGVYNGYGKIDETDIFQFAVLGKKREVFFDDYNANLNRIKIIRQDYFETLDDSGISYDQLKPSKKCPDQGFFYDDKKRKKLLESRRPSKKSTTT